MDELKRMLLELGKLASSLPSGVELPKELMAQLESQRTELNLPNDPQQLRKRLKQEQRQLKANLKKLSGLSGSSSKAGNEQESSSEESSDSDTEVSSEVGAFLGAAALGNTAFCSIMLQRGIDVNCHGQHGATALHAAAQENHSDVINLLVSRGADVNSIDSDGDTALMVAVIKKHRPLVQLFADRGTDLTIKNKKGFTAADLAFISEDLETVILLEERVKALQFDCKVHQDTILAFAQKGSTKMIEFWLSNYPGVDGLKPCNQQYKDGRTIAFAAALNGSEELLALVDSLEADLDLPDNTNSSPLFCACQNGYGTIVNMLIEKGCDVNRVRDTGRTPIFSAIVNSHTSIVKILVDAGADINIKDTNGNCPLACSIISGCQEIFEYLVNEKDADCNVVDENGNDLVLLAALYKRFSMLKRLHEKCLPLDAVNLKDRETALLSACQVNCPEMVEFLISNGCDVNRVNKNGVTPTLRAAFNNDLATVKLLDRYRADLDVPNKRGETAILVAAQKKSVPLVKFLHNRGCNIHVVDKNGHTLAFYAAQGNDTSMLDLLKEYQAPLDVQNKRGNTPLLFAAMKPPNLPMLKQLVACECNVDTRNNSGNTAVSTAAKQGSMEVLKYLHSVGEDLVNITKKGKTVIMQASKRNQISVLRLIKADSTAVKDINATDDLGRTAVHYAAIGGHCDVLDFLVHDMKANFDCKDAEGNTPFMLAIKKNKRDIAEKLHDLGADVNLRNNNGENAVHLAVQAESLELIKHLEQKGCYLDQEDKNGRTPLMLACAKKKLLVMNFLLSRGCFPKSFSRDGRQVIHVACETGKYQVARRLIDLGVPVHAADSDGVTTLMLASLAGSKKIVDTLIKKKADLVSMRDKNGKSALEYAIIGGHSKLLRLLINSGCDVNHRLSDGRTPLLIAIQSSVKNTDEIVHILIEHGCRLDAATADGMNAAHLACQSNKLSVLKVLIEKGASLDQLTNNADSCLTLAVPTGSTELVGLLIDAGLDKSHVNSERHSAVSLACKRGDEEILSKLSPISDGDMSQSYTGDNSLLHFACEGGSMKLVESLIDRNIPLNASNSSSETALHVACSHGRRVIVTLLLQRGADPNMQNANGETPIFNAVSKGDKHICELLINKNVDTNLINKDGVSVLAMAFRKGNRSVIKMLRNVDARLSADSLPETFEVFRSNLLSGRFQNLNALLDEGLPVDRRENQWHLLHLAIETSRSDLISTLMERRASVKVKDSRGNTPLLTAIRFGRIDVAKKILEEHPETKDDVNNDGDTVLHVAVSENKISTVLWLLQKFKPIKDAKNNKGMILTHIAALKGNEAMLSLLRKRGCYSQLSFEEGRKKFTLAHLAALSGNMQFLRSLYDPGSLPSREEVGKSTPSVLQLLAETGQSKTFQWLCDTTGVNIDDTAFVPVRNAAFFNGHEHISKWLIQRGVDLEICDERSGHNAISSGVLAGNFHLCRELIEKLKVNLKVVTRHDESLVQHAVVADHEPILRYLKQRDAPIELPDLDGDSPTLKAVNLIRPRLLRVLHEEFGCDLQLQNKLERNAAHLAAIAGNLETIDYLRQNLPETFFHECDVHQDTPLMLAVLHDQFDAAKFLLEKFRPNVNHQNETGSCALHWAATQKPDLKLIRLLLDNGAAVDTADQDEATPLMLAVQAKSVESIRALLDSGASLTAENRFGDSALALMLHSDDSSVRQLGETLRLESAIEIRERVPFENPLGHLTVRSFHYYDHFPNKRPQHLIEAETASEEENEANAASNQELLRQRQPTRAESTGTTRSHVSHTSESMVPRFDIPDRLPIQAVQPDSRATGSQSGSVSQLVLSNSFNVSVEPDSSIKASVVIARLNQSMQTMLQVSIMEMMQFHCQEEQINVDDFSYICRVLDLQVKLMPQPYLELTLDQPGEKLDVFLDNFREKINQQFSYLDVDMGKLVAKEILKGLEFLHSKGVTHGSLRLANVRILADSRRLKLSHYGQFLRLVQLAGSPQSSGSRRYEPWTPPEDRRRGAGMDAVRKPTTREADMWAFGCTLHEALIGRPPESGAHDLSEEYLIRTFADAQGVDRSVSGLLRKDRIFPDELAAVFRRVYQDVPGDRASASSLLSGLSF